MMRGISMSLATLVALSSTAVGSSSTVADFALGKILSDASQIFGDYVKDTGKLATWMKAYPDDTPLIRMNIPGTHDSSTWNYTQATQNSLLNITTELNQVVVPPPQAFRCQEQPYITMLNKGIRAFDLRYASDPTNTTLLFYHSQALLSEVATVTDVLFGFYKWLDDHPSETVILSFQYEGSTALYAANDVSVQMMLYNALTDDAARHYFLQKQGELGTLGESRGKIILMRRFDMDQLPAHYTTTLPGLHFSPNLWTDNDPTIQLIYNPAKNLTAYIEDYYQPLTLQGSSAAENIQWKYNATTANINKAVGSKYADSLFWTWASSENTVNVPPETPQIMALGNGTKYTPEGGVNARMVKFLGGLKGKRVGIVMFDFFDQPANLVETLLSLQPAK